jgi:hypothetical protein
MVFLVSVVQAVQLNLVEILQVVPPRKLLAQAVAAILVPAQTQE